MGVEGMRIKEIEEKTGMERSNIRFYEREGLIDPKRMENGYRDYSPEDFEILLKVKLLRSLHIPLDEIKALKEGSKDLSITLGEQIKNLDQEKQDVSYAQDVCRAMQKEETDFTNLDAQKYLEGINRITEESGSSYFIIKADELPQVFHPWRRFFARVIDFYIYNTLWLAVLVFVLQINVSNRNSFGDFIDTFVALLMMLFLEPLWLRHFGTTPGKAIFGLRIENAYGRHLSYGDGLERTWGVIGCGLGYNIPIYNIYRLWKSYETCTENEILSWDELLSYNIKDTKRYRILVCLCSYAVLFFIGLALFSSQLLPPNRGDITIAEFVENHNYYADYLGIYFGNEYLNEDGEWAEKELDGTAFFTIGNNVNPEYKFVLEDGYVKGISFEIEIENNKDWLRSYDTKMILTSLAFAGAQDEVDLFSKIPRRITENIKNNEFYSFNFTEVDIHFICEINSSGYNYYNQSGVLIPKEDTEENYFSLKFSMSK